MKNVSIFAKKVPNGPEKRVFKTKTKTGKVDNQMEEDYITEGVFELPTADVEVFIKCI